MNKNIEEINRIRELQLSKRKQVEENNKKLQLENEERNKVLKEVDEVRNQWMKAVEKYDVNLNEEENKSKMSPKEIDLYNADYLELPIRVDGKYFKCIEEGYGLYCLNGFTNYDERFIEFNNTRMLFSEEERKKYIAFLKTSKGIENDTLKIGKALSSITKNIKEDKEDNLNKTEDNKIDIEPLIRFIVDGKDFSKEECNKILNKITVLSNV